MSPDARAAALELPPLEVLGGEGTSVLASSSSGGAAFFLLCRIGFFFFRPSESVFFFVRRDLSRNSSLCFPLLPLLNLPPPSILLPSMVEVRPLEDPPAFVSRSAALGELSTSLSLSLCEQSPEAEERCTSASRSLSVAACFLSRSAAAVNRIISPWSPCRSHLLCCSLSLS